MRRPAGTTTVVTYLLAAGREHQRRVAERHDGADDGGARGIGSTRRELLIARGADVNHRNENGASALDWAKRGNEVDLEKELRRAGARD